jgi:DNA polymerase III subunit beta
MKFKIPQSDLLKTLLAVNKSLLAKANLPILANVLVTASKEGIEVLSTDLETATKVDVVCKTDVLGKTAIPGRMLLEFVSQLPDGEVIFEKLGGEVLVKSGSYSARLATMQAEDFPAIPKIEKGQAIKFGAGDFVRAVLKVAFCAAVDEGRPVLTGVLCEIEKKLLSMVATDGYRLGFQKIPTGGEGFPVKIVVPAKSLIEVAKLIGERVGEKEGGNVEVVIADNLNQVNFKVDNVEFTSRLIEGEFPNWQKIIPTTFNSSAKISKEEFIKLVRVASIFARDSGNIVRLKLEGGTMTIFATNSQVGSNEAACGIEMKGSGGEIAFNFRYLLEMLSSIEGEDVNFEMIESLNPGRFTEADGNDNFFHIIMPVRLQS